MKKKLGDQRILRLGYSFFLFFLAIAFVVSSCMILFLKTMNIAFTEENIRTAAMLTFCNTLLISLLATLFDKVRRTLTVDRTAKEISIAAKQITKGNFCVRMQPVSRFFADDNLNEIIDCFNTLAEELSGVETLRTDFIANVSHELKTPLAVIQNYGTLLQAPDLPEEKRMEYVRAITEASRRLADLISNILKLNKLENQQIYPEIQCYDLGEQLCECFLNFESIWEKKEIDIDTDIEEGVYVEADRELLALVWNNLFSNAFKFTETGGKVSIRLATGDGYALVSICDTGCGISPEVGKHIFEKFYQGDTSHATQGNGLGLALVKRVVDIVGGAVSVESEVGKGSTFTVKIECKSDDNIKK